MIKQKQLAWVACLLVALLLGAYWLGTHQVVRENAADPREIDLEPRGEPLSDAAPSALVELPPGQPNGANGGLEPVGERAPLSEPPFDPYAAINQPKGPLIREELDVWSLRQILDEFQGKPTGGIFWGQTSDHGKLIVIHALSVAAIMDGEGVVPMNGGTVPEGTIYVDYNGTGYCYKPGRYPVADEIMAWKKEYMKARGQVLEEPETDPPLKLSPELRERIINFATEALEIRRGKLLAMRAAAKH